MMRLSFSIFWSFLWRFFVRTMIYGGTYYFILISIGKKLSMGEALSFTFTAASYPLTIVLAFLSMQIVFRKRKSDIIKLLEKENRKNNYRLELTIISSLIGLTFASLLLIKAGVIPNMSKETFEHIQERVESNKADFNKRSQHEVLFKKAEELLQTGNYEKSKEYAGKGQYGAALNELAKIEKAKKMISAKLYNRSKRLKKICLDGVNQLISIAEKSAKEGNLEGASKILDGLEGVQKFLPISQQNTLKELKRILSK